MSLGRPLNESRLTVCCCSSSTPLAPRSLAGSKTCTTARRTRWRSVRPPTSAISRLSANLVLRLGRWGRRMAQVAAHDAADPNHDAARDIDGGHDQQHHLRRYPDQVDERA